MALIDWPASLPLPLQDGYEEAPPVTVRRWQPDHGPALVRRLGGNNVSILRLNFEMTRTEANIFDDFYRVTSRGGSIPFNFTHPRTSVVRDCRIVSVSYASREQFVTVAVEMVVLP